MVMMNAWMDGCLYGIPSETKKLESLKRIIFHNSPFNAHQTHEYVAN